MVNKVILIGNVGQDPEIRHTPSGSAVANFTLATSEKYTKDGERHEETEWHRIVIWGKLAEIVGEYVKKGSKLYLEGKNKTRKFEDRDGNDRYITEVVCFQMQMLDSRQSGESSQSKSQAAKPKPPEGFEDFDDDIPF